MIDNKVPKLTKIDFDAIQPNGDEVPMVALYDERDFSREEAKSIIATSFIYERNPFPENIVFMTVQQFRSVFRSMSPDDPEDSMPEVRLD